MNTRKEQAIASSLINVSYKKSPVPTESLPDSMEERDLHMQLAYKPAIEIAEEEAINTVLATNEFDLIRARVNQDLVNIGIGITKTSFNPSRRYSC
jgi:hypothetical protein